MSKYADVALPVAVYKTFTYLIPPDLETSGVVGVRAIVPFGRKYVTGMIVGHPVNPTVKGIKPISDVLDSAPVLSDELLQLCRWIAEYYIAPLGEVLKAALPQRFSLASTRIVRPMIPVSGIPENLPSQRRRMLDLIVNKGSIPVRELKRRTGLRSINAVLNDMVHAGYIELEEMIPRPKQTVRLKEVILLSEVNEATISSTLQTLSPRKRRARALLRTVMALRGEGLTEIETLDLVKQSGASSGVVKEFRASGLLPTVHREVESAQDHGTDSQTISIILNGAQQKALVDVNSAIISGQHKTFLLHGVTGSGKTQVYIEAIRLCLDRGESAIVLVPEISLTPQTVRRFNTHFPGQVAVVHSRMSQGERYAVWRHVLAGKYRVVIGPRSAVFAPVSNLGLLVVDEEHEASYKQYDAVPRYHARDAAIVRASLCNAVVILGSATPSIESYYNAKKGKYRLLELPARIDNIPMPEVTLIDMREERRREYTAAKEQSADGKTWKWREFRQGSVSAHLQERIRESMSRGEGIILLQNRRGFAPFVECPDCGYAESCERCSVTLTYHLAKKHLRCHYCGTVYSPHNVCPQCGGENLRLKGIGTQRVEEELGKLFPGARILRMDLDTTSRKGAHERLLRKFGDGHADILLGTQMVAKGLDFPRVTLVGVISADTQMLLPDFRSDERTFQLLTQVAGRSGRSALSGEVVIQTHQPGHYTLQHVIDHDYKAFYEEEMAGREELEYPPFSRLVLVEFKGENEDHVRVEAERFRDTLRANDGVFALLGPAPAVIARIKDLYRWHLIIKIPKAADPTGAHLRMALRKTMATLAQKQRRSLRVIIDVDPVGLM